MQRDKKKGHTASGEAVAGTDILVEASPAGAEASSVEGSPTGSLEAMPEWLQRAEVQDSLQQATEALGQAVGAPFPLPPLIPMLCHPLCRYASGACRFVREGVFARKFNASVRGEAGSGQVLASTLQSTLQAHCSAHAHAHQACLYTGLDVSLHLPE